MAAGTRQDRLVEGLLAFFLRSNAARLNNEHHFGLIWFLPEDRSARSTFGASRTRPVSVQTASSDFSAELMKPRRSCRIWPCTERVAEYVACTLTQLQRFVRFLEHRLRSLA